MDAAVTRELKKIEASLALIEDRLVTIEIEKAKAAAVGADFPAMPFPGFDQASTSLPI